MARVAIALLFFASCKGGDHGALQRAVNNVATPAPSGASDIVAAAPSGATDIAAPAPSGASDIVASAPSGASLAGWVRLEPSGERRRCANYSRDEWRVSVDHGAVQIAKATTPEPESGPPLPFTLPELQELRGRHHVLAFAGGYLVGSDAGEWGGSLYWFARDGGQQQQLASENVRGLVAFGADVALAIEGLAHLSISRGEARWLERKGGLFDATAVTKLPAAPQTFAAVGDGVYVLTTSSLVRLGRDRKLKTIQPVDTSGLYPDSMVADASGTLWVGMRQFVLRLSPKHGRFSETWLVREDCQRAVQIDSDCVCRGG